MRGLEAEKGSLVCWCTVFGNCCSFSLFCVQMALKWCFVVSWQKLSLSVTPSLGAAQRSLKACLRSVLLHALLSPGSPPLSSHSPLQLSCRISPKWPLA